MLKKILLLSLLSINGTYSSYAADDPISSEEKYSGKRKRTDTELPLNKKQKTELTEEQKSSITDDFLKYFNLNIDQFARFKQKIMSGVLIIQDIEMPHHILIEISKLTWLTHLSLKNVGLTEYSFSFDQLNNLKFIDLSNNNITYFPGDILTLSNLTYFDLSNNLLTLLPHNIGNLKELTYLNLYNNRLIELPDSIEHLVKLENFILGAEESFLNMPDRTPKKEKERLMNEFLASFSPNDFKFTNYQKDIFIKNGLIKISNKKINYEQIEKLFNCTWLHNIDISNCNLKYLPDNISNLKNLRLLNISNNPLGALHDAVMTLPHLEDLNISNIRLDFLPMNMEGLKNLRILNVTDNNLKCLSKSIGDLHNLEELILERNQIQEVDESISNLNKLKKLDISENKLLEVPDFIGDLENLRTLDLSVNDFVELPDSIGDLKHLQYLKLESCPELLSLPASIARLERIILINLESAHSLVRDGDEDTLGTRELREIFADRVILTEYEDEEDEFIIPIKKKVLYQHLDEQFVSINRETIKDYKMPDVIDLEWDAMTFIENWNKLLNFLILDGEKAVSYKLLANDFSEDSSLEGQQLSNKEKIEKFIFPRLNGFVKTLWGIPLAENEKSGWQMYSNSIPELRKNISYIVSRLIENNVDSETRHVLMAQITNAFFHCPTGQKEGISLILLSLSTERKNEKIIDEIFKILAIEKNIIFKTTMLQGNSSQNTHILSYYFDELKDELALTSNFESFDEKIGRMGRDPFGGHKGNALSAFYAAFNPNHIVKVIIDNIENEENWNSRQRLSDLDNPPTQEEMEKINECLLKAEKNRRIKISDIVGYLKSIGLITQSFSGGVLRTNGWEPYFKNDPNGDKFAQPKIEGIEAILMHMKILKRKN